MKSSVLLVDSKGRLHGRKCLARFYKLPWYKRLFGHIFRPYKRKYTDIKPYDCEILSNSDKP